MGKFRENSRHHAQECARNFLGIFGESFPQKPLVWESIVVVVVPPTSILLLQTPFTIIFCVGLAGSNEPSLNNNYCIIILFGF